MSKSLTVAQDPARRAVAHPVMVRLTHWINAVAMVVMIMSGLQIYNASPIFPFTFPPQVTLGGWLGGGIQWHLAGMWVIVVNYLAMAVYGFASGRYAAKLWPIRPAEVLADLRAALGGRLGHADITRYNGVQKLLYAGVLVIILVAVLSGFAIWKPAQLSLLADLFGGFQGARLAHFLAMAAITAFAVIHIIMALVVPKTLLAIVRGH